MGNGEIEAFTELFNMITNLNKSVAGLTDCVQMLKERVEKLEEKHG